MLARIVSIPLTFISPTCYLLSILSILLPSLHTQNLSYHLNGEAPRLTDGQTESGQTQSYLTDLWPPTIQFSREHFRPSIYWKRHRIWWWCVAIRRKCPLTSPFTAPDPLRCWLYFHLPFPGYPQLGWQKVGSSVWEAGSSLLADLTPGSGS